MLEQVFLAHFECEVTPFGPWKIPKCLEKGPFLDEKCVCKMHQNRAFRKVTLDPRMLTQTFLAHLKP